MARGAGVYLRFLLCEKDERLWLPLDGTLIHRRLAPSRRWYSFTDPRKLESWVSLGGKEGRTNIRISAKPSIEPGTLWLEGRDLTNCTLIKTYMYFQLILSYSATETKKRWSLILSSPSLSLGVQLFPLCTSLFLDDAHSIFLPFHLRQIKLLKFRTIVLYRLCLCTKL